MTCRWKAWCAIPGPQLAPGVLPAVPQLLLAFCILCFSCYLWILKLLDLQMHTLVRSELLPKGRESRHSQLCHLLISCVPQRRQHPVLFHLPAPGPVPRTSLNFFAKAFSLQDVLRVSNAPMSCLNFFPKSSLDNSQFVTQDYCLSKENHCQMTIGHGTCRYWGQPLISGQPLPP